MAMGPRMIPKKMSPTMPHIKEQTAFPLTLLGPLTTAVPRNLPSSIAEGEKVEVAAEAMVKFVKEVAGEIWMMLLIIIMVL
jgi:hypothetical protein